ncbi:tellurite resistance TerB family protein [Citreimonas sp.]|uniref:tellurite resistance TerB family protein n=1 Tax=Citreimonas sp. TaxID=3036715 RepID=UPI0040592E5C
MLDLEDPLSPQDCLVALMIVASASDETMRTTELLKIDTAVRTLPIFGAYDPDRVRAVSTLVMQLLAREDGLDALFDILRRDLPQRLFETAYALACDVAAADGTLADAELRLLEEIRYELDLARRPAAASARGARPGHFPG